jgi:hypothetical protein
MYRTITVKKTHYRIKIQHASGIIKWFLRLAGYQGFPTLWRVVHIMPGYLSDNELIEHELAQCRQMEHDGRIVFLVKYSWWFLRYGYEQNPYEVQARKEAKEAVRGKA